ncbi:hypothetical protein KAR91_85565, partial [Candidatus Pacearchaeota archaeon]|nr:hypothetical protein [Candidatus Pacearchaeota archaeon]
DAPPAKEINVRIYALPVSYANLSKSEKHDIFWESISESNLAGQLETNDKGEAIFSLKKGYYIIQFQNTV